MAYFPTDEDIRLLSQRTKNLHCRIEFLDEKMNKIDSLEGLTVSGSIDIDGTSDIRRTYSASLVLPEKHSLSKYSEDEWMNKYVWIYLGIEKRNGEIAYYSLGLYAFSQNGFRYDATSRTLDISCVDLVAKLDDTLAGQITGGTYAVEEGASIRNAIIATAGLAGFTKHMVTYRDATVPYELTYDVGASLWDILSELRDLYYPYEIFFDNDTFVCQQIPSCYEDPVVIGADIFDRLVVSEDSTVDYTQVRNCVEVFGAAIEADVYAAESSGDSASYILSTELATIDDNTKISFCAPATNIEGPTLTVINRTTDAGDMATIGPFPIYAGLDVDGANVVLATDTMFADKYYVVKYSATEQAFYFLGSQQAHAMVMLVDTMPTEEEYATAQKEENCDNLKYIVTSDPSNWSELYQSRMSIERIGRRNKVLSGGDYEVYSTDEECMEIAKYEHWKLCRLNDSINVTTLIIPWLQVNQKVEYTAKYLGGRDIAQFIVKKISMSLGEGTMTITLNRFYPYYPFIVEEE